MGLNIKNPEVERLAAEVAELAGETKTEAIRQALLERQARMRARGGRDRKPGSLKDYFERSVWPLIPRSELGRTLTREEEDEILGYGRIDAEIIPFGEAHFDVACAAFLRFGKGRHPASLNYGDCMAYAVAAVANAPLLFTGNDFARTDIAAA